ncbi:unnamed protein product [Cylindrotheca closterium]|uniref:Mannosylglycerate hydrolase MGH1-like glycoside hydrolase domain-containing protein n=1 Tax=Cylindrotheca closterium TaxID=2856 RepID=A0AAD2CLZ5_9STRA|nr:unnamed protein product [Cylindrotheca closterium]
MKECLILLLLSSEFFTSGNAQQVTLQAYDNTAMVGMPIEEWALDYDSTVSIPGMVSVRVMGSIPVVADPAMPKSSSIYVDCGPTQSNLRQQNDEDEDNVEENVPGFFWLDDHLVCQSGFYNITTLMQMDGSIHTPIVVSSRRTEWVLYGEFWPQNERFSLTNIVADIISVSSQNHATRSIFRQVKSTVSPLEQRRIRLAQQLQNGWGLYNHNSLQEAILLPEGIRLKWEFCGISDSSSSCDKSPKIPATVRPLVASVTPARNTAEVMQFEVGYPAQNATLEVTYRFGPNDSMELTFHSTSAPTNGYIRFSADVAYFPARRGSIVTSSSSSISVSAVGLRSITFCACSLGRSSGFPVEESNRIIMVPVPEAGHSFTVHGFDSTEMDETEYDCMKKGTQDVTMIQNQLQDSKLATLIRGIDAAIYYNLIYTPMERTLIAPVSRGWGKALCMPALLPEHEYVLFDWDNVLVAYMMGIRRKKDLAYASLIQVVRSRTAKGFIPNFSAGGAKSQDRTEPPLAAKVLLFLAEKFDDKWIVDYLWDDLAIQMDWFWSNRRLDDFIVLGSDPVLYPNSHSTNTMQGARYESGLDNSPMYDGNFFKGNLMQLYDVGMTSLVLQECESLITLASLIGKDPNNLKHRAKLLRQSLQKLWDPDYGIYTNMFVNGTFYKRRSPTSFYPLLSKVATDAQVGSMVEHWLTNETRFCIGRRTEDCWWGLPSISADDPAFSGLGNWRGYVWGPMSILVYWALDNYSHLPQVSLAKYQLANQMSDMFLNLWEKKGRICENYSPRHNSTECTGDRFYHWGALAGVLALMERNETELTTSISRL